MFRKLRNKFILTSMLTTTAILVVAFSAIFIATVIKQQQRTTAPNDMIPTEMEQVFEDEMVQERSNHLASLAVTLVLVGVLTEFSVYIVSYYVAEQSIKPVREAYEKQREFIANASHELKTPLATIQANFEALGPDEQPWTENIETELTRANKLVGDLLTLARSDGRTSIASKKSFDLSQFVKERAKLIEARLGKKKLTLDVPKEDVMTLAEADLRQILDILLDNAVKYSKSKIEVILKDKTLIVRNDGKVIPPEKIARIFDRFYQVDKTAEGSGLGLSIAKAVADQNNWKLVATSDQKWTSFSVNF